MKKFSDFLNEISQVPVGDGKNVGDKEILRQAIMAEYDAVNLYEQMAKSTKNEKIKKILLSVSQEEKVHIGEFEAILDEIDKEHKSSVQDGKKEAT